MKQDESGSYFGGLIRQLKEQDGGKTDTPLDALRKPQNQRDGQGVQTTHEPPESPSASRIGANRAIAGDDAPPKTEIERLQAELEYFREENRRVYAKYQDNIRRSGGLVSEVIKGAKAGEPAEALLLTACKILDLMRGDANLVTYNVVKKALVTNGAFKETEEK